MPKLKPVLPLISPPDVFGIVLPGVYRSNTFGKESFSFVKSLGLRTVVSFDTEEYASKRDAEELSRFFERRNVVQISVNSMQSRKSAAFALSMAEEIVKRVLEIVLSERHHPVLVMCGTGVHDTGIIFGCLRRFLRWSFTAAIDENRGFAACAGTKTRHMNEVFVESFDNDLITLPQDLPPWAIGISRADDTRRGGTGVMSTQDKTVATDEDISARHREFTKAGPLVSADCTYSAKLSICEEALE